MTLSQRSRSSVRSRSSKKNEKYGKLAETCGELKFTFLKFPYKFGLYYGLSHFVVAEHWCRGAMYIHASIYLLSQTWHNTCSSQILCENQVVKMKVANTCTFRYYEHSISRAITIKRYVLDNCTKNEADPNRGLGGVYENSDTHTYRQVYAIMI